MNSSLVDAFEEFLNAQPLQPPPAPPAPPPRPPSPIVIQQPGCYFGPSKRTSWGDRGGGGGGGGAGGGGSFGSVGLVSTRAKGKNKGSGRGKGSAGGSATAAGVNDGGTSGQGLRKSKKPKASKDTMAQLAQAMAGVNGGDSIFELAAIIEQEGRERNVDAADEQRSQIDQSPAMQSQS